MKKREFLKKPLIKVVLRILVSFFILGLIFHFLPLSSVWDSMHRVSYKFWSVIVIGYVFTHFVGTLKWMILIRMGDAKLNVMDACRCYFAGLFASLFLPSMVGGDVLRAGIAMRLTKRKMGIVFGSLLDRLIDIASLCILIVGAGGLVHGEQNNQRWYILLIVFLLFIIIASCGVFIMVFRPPNSWPVKIRYRIQRIRLGFRKLYRQPFYAITGLSLSLIVQGVLVLINIALGKVVGIKLAHSIWFLTWPLAKIAAMLPISFCGFGVREAAFAGLLQPFGVQPSYAIAQCIIWDTVIIAGGLLGGAIWIILGRIRKLNK